MTLISPPHLLQEAQRRLKRIWGYDQFRGVQAEIIGTVAAGQSALVLMPTGGGKSLCYQLPSLLRPGVGVVISPLIALMKDQVDTLQALGVRAAFLNSSLSTAQTAQIEEALHSGLLDLLYIAPERLLQPRMLEQLQHLQIALFAIDEAHCVSQWGHDFRPEYGQLQALAEKFPQIPRLALTATADERTRADIRRVLSLQRAPQFVSSFDRPNIQYRVSAKAGPKTQLLDFIREEHLGDAGIVYCLSRRSVEETAQWLDAQGIPALAYHAGLSNKARQYAQDRFLNEEGLVVVATVAFGMGIDKPNVRFVAHLDLPKSLEGYYQETGRAGRDGLPSTAWMVYGLSDVVNVKRMLAQSQAPEAVKRVEAAKLDALLSYGETANCRRQVLLSYFGEEHPGQCGQCDNCLNPPPLRDATREAQMVLSAAIRTGNRFGAAYLTDVLLGQATPKILGLGHHQLPTFGVGVQHDEKTWRGLIRQLISLDYLSAGEHHGLSATAQSTPLLRGQTRLMVRESSWQPAGERKHRNSKKDALPAADQPLFETLRQWRLARAKALQVPPYVIFSDATLRQLAQERPDSHAALGTISGIGQRKLAEYGDEVLQLLHQAGPEPEPVQPRAPNLAVAEALRLLRKELAQEHGHSAFVIFPNATLEALAERQPRSLAELEGVPGLGPKRAQAYGPQIVDAVRTALDGA